MQLSHTNVRPSRLAVLAAGTLASAATASPRVLDITVTSEAGQKLASVPTVEFRPGSAAGVSIAIDPADVQQTIDGIGSSFTESSAFVLAHLEPERRREVMQRIFGVEGANFTLTRTHIGSCDFSVEGRYAYQDSPDATFTIAPDRAGFNPATYPGIKDETYDLLPMIQEAIEIKRAQGDEPPRLIASAWTAPPWMKDTGEWFTPGSPANNWQGTGGSLLPEHEQTYAGYLVEYLDAYNREGVEFWGITPVNEPHGNSGSWESMHFTAESQNQFIKEHMGPALKGGGHGDVNVLIYDQNRPDMQTWADAIFGDPDTAPFVYGMAIHWYGHTEDVFAGEIQAVRERYPQFPIIHTEGCIDNLGTEAPPTGIADRDGWQETDWFNNDAFWWNRNATDWGYTAEWAGGGANHPMYVPVHRYARNIIGSIDAGVTGWIDWNVVLDAQGGPNHVGNFCGAPIMIDTDSGFVYETPIFHVLAQFSRTIRPGDRALGVTTNRAVLDADALHACATLNADGIVAIQVLNTTKQPIDYTLELQDHTASVTIPANAVQTVRVQMEK